MTAEEYRAAAVDAVRKLSADVGIPADLKAIVREEDESAFMFITEAHEALGEGFSRLSAD